MSHLTRDYKGAGRHNLRLGGMKEFALGVLAGALLAGGIATLIAAHGRHRRAVSSLACAPATGSAQVHGNATAGSGSGAPAPVARSAAPAPSRTAAGTGAAGKAAPAQHYDFYQMLPRLTVPVPGQSAAAQARRSDRPATSPSYLLQVGSYSSDAEARQIVERLAHMEIGAQIQRVTERGRALDRVRVGPVDGAGLAGMRRKLAAAGFHPLVIPTRRQ